MDVLEPQAIDRRQVEKALLVFRKLPTRKRDRVLKLLDLLQVAECQDECGEIVRAIAEIIAKAAGQIPAGGRTVNLESGVNGKAKETLAAYHCEIGRAIRKRREELELTQEELAVKSGLPQSHISRLEAGLHTPTRITIRRIAKALKTDPGKIDLLYD